MRWPIAWASISILLGCASGSNNDPDARVPVDASTSDAPGSDPDGSVADAGPPDAMWPDAPPPDAMWPDAPPPDAMPGDDANPLEVVINEVNWFGNADSSDEWIELRNTTAATTIDISNWTIDNAGSGAGSVTIAVGTVLAPGEYALIAAKQGPDVAGMRTSLTGVSNVQLHTMNLSNSGEQLVLHDIDGTVIDSTPAGAWPAGDNGSDRSMERRDDLTGGGYTDGTMASAWYTWNVAAGTDTTNPDTSDSGTPGAANSDPAGTLPVLTLPYTTSFESGQPAFEKVAGAGVFSNAPPAGTTARTGTQVITNSSITTSYTGREIQSANCIMLNNDTTPVSATIYAAASTANGGNQLTGRLVALWYTDACATAATTPASTGSGIALTEGSYVQIDLSATPPTGATHMKLRFELHDDNGGTNTDDDWAGDDVSITQ